MPAASDQGIQDVITICFYVVHVLSTFGSLLLHDSSNTLTPVVIRGINENFREYEMSLIENRVEESARKKPAVEMGQGLRKLAKHRLEKRNRPVVETGGGIRKLPRNKLEERKRPLVETGGGIRKLPRNKLEGRERPVVETGTGIRKLLRHKLAKRKTADC